MYAVCRGTTQQYLARHSYEAQRAGSELVRDGAAAPTAKGRAIAAGACGTERSKPARVADLERGARRSPYPATVRRLTQALDLSDADRAVLLSSAAAYQPVTHPAQDENFRSLPRTLSGFIGREREKPKILHLLETARLVTLTGTGGTGKTRLAREVAADTDAVAFVDLAPLSDGELIGAAVAEVVGIRAELAAGTSSGPWLSPAALHSHLRTRQPSRSWFGD